MTRVVLLLFFGLAAALYFPESRAVIVEKARPALDPAYRWQSLHEMEMIADELSIYERDNYGSMPPYRTFTGWIEENFTAGAAEDSWGSPYVLFEEGESFSVISWGPDKTPRTADDLRVLRRFTRAR
jgi:hypothetical protein